MLALTAVQWPFAEFPLTEAARNFFFAVDQFDFDAAPGAFQYQFWGGPMTAGAAGGDRTRRGRVGPPRPPVGRLDGAGTEVAWPLCAGPSRRQAVTSGRARSPLSRVGEPDGAAPEAGCRAFVQAGGSVGARPLAALLIVGGSVAAAGMTASAHVGTSNAYFDGAAGPYGVRVIVRTPGVIPGLAQVSVRILGEGGEDVERVTVRPLRSDVGWTAPRRPTSPRPVPSEAGLFSGGLWLMTAGSYSVEVGVAGPAGAGAVFVPVLAVAERRLAMSPAVGLGLAGAALFLFVGAVTIVGAAVRESVLEPGREPDASRRRRGRLAMAAVTIVLGAVLGGGWLWWDAVDAAYLSRIYQPWSTTAEVAAAGGAQTLTLAIDDRTTAKSP